MHDWNEEHSNRLLIDDYLASGGTQMSAAFRAAFPTDDDLVRELHMRWVHLVDGCLETELETGDGTLSDAAYVRAAQHAPELRQALTTFAGSPVLAGLAARHDAHIASAIGAMQPSHTLQEGIDAVRQLTQDLAVPVQRKPSRVERWRREREVNRLVRRSLMGY
jgi:hypothetical protein